MRKIDFFLEQVATNYLPEALAIYKAFAGAGKEQKEAAEKTLLDYFEAVETKILQIFFLHYGAKFKLFKR